MLSPDDTTPLPGWSLMMAPLPPQFHGVIPGTDDFHSSGSSGTRTEAMGHVGNAQQYAHTHAIDEDWSVAKKNMVARHIDSHHPRKGSTCRACGVFALVGTVHDCLI